MRAVVFASWMGFFAWLWIGGDMTRYLGPRTYWVVLFGGIVCALATVASLSRESRASGMPRGAAIVLLLPIAAALAVPDADLGSLAAARKTPSSGVGAAGFAIPAPETDGVIDFQDIYYAQEAPDYALTVGAVEGAEIELVGFVSSLGTERFELTRFYVSCCAADALPYSATVVGHEGDVQEDQWARVEGVLTRRADELVVDAENVEVISAPRDPYLY